MRYKQAATQAWAQFRERLRRCFGLQRRPGPKVLVVRGSRMAAEMTKVFRRYGLNIEVAERASLLDYARRTQPALIISDLSLSGMSEMEDALRLRQLLPACKVMLFSAQGLRRTSLPRESEPELVRTVQRLCADPLSGQMLWLDLARLVQVMPRQRSMAA